MFCWLETMRKNPTWVQLALLLLQEGITHPGISGIYLHSELLGGVWLDENSESKYSLSESCLC